MNMKHTFQGDGEVITVITYETLDGVVAELFPADAEDYWLIAASVPMADVPHDKPTISDMKDTIRKRHKCWGFARCSKSEIHVWIGADAQFDDVLALFGHEFGHMQPRHDDEEMRADSFAVATVRAFETTRVVFLQEALARK